MGTQAAAILETVGAVRLLPVVVLDHEEAAMPLARALQEGGLPVAEVTFQAKAAAGAIRRIAAEVPGVLSAPGAVLTEEQPAEAANAGASFIVTPGFNPKVVEAALNRGLPIVPGANNPTGVEQALSYGLDTAKFFPAEATGGAPFLKALTGPYSDMRFVPTGEIGKENLASYLASKAVLACGNSRMVDAELVRAGRSDEIRALTAEAVAVAKSA